MEKLFSLANFRKSPVTTGLGIIIILASVITVFTHGRTWTEAGAGCAIGTGLLGIKDPNGGGGATGVVGGLLLCVLLAVGGCASQKHLLAKYGTQNPPTTLALSDTLHIPVAVKTKADALSTSLSLDSLADARTGDTLHLRSHGGQATMKVWKSSARQGGGTQRLHARVDVPTRVIHDTITKIVTQYGKCPPSYTISAVHKPNVFQRGWHHYQDFCTALVSLLLLLLLLYMGFRIGVFKFLKFLPFLAVVGLLASGCRSQRSPYRFPAHQPSYLSVPPHSGDHPKFRPDPLLPTTEHGLHRPE